MNLKNLSLNLKNFVALKNFDPKSKTTIEKETILVLHVLNYENQLLTLEDILGEEVFLQDSEEIFVVGQKLAFLI